jgi:hypothetical protein
MSERTEAGRRAGPPPGSRDLRGLLSPSPEAEPFDSAEFSTFFFTSLVMTVYVVEHIAERLSIKLVTYQLVKASTRTRCPMRLSVLRPMTKAPEMRRDRSSNSLSRRRRNTPAPGRRRCWRRARRRSKGAAEQIFRTLGLALASPGEARRLQQNRPDRRRSDQPRPHLQDPFGSDLFGADRS